MVIVFGASALCDFDDVIPAAIRQAGGEVAARRHAGRPGNLHGVGATRRQACHRRARLRPQPKENGFDWVLDRLTAGLDSDGRRHRRHGCRRLC